MVHGSTSVTSGTAVLADLHRRGTTAIAIDHGYLCSLGVDIFWNSILVTLGFHLVPSFNNILFFIYLDVFKTRRQIGSENKTKQRCKIPDQVRAILLLLTY